MALGRASRRAGRGGRRHGRPSACSPQGSASVPGPARHRRRRATRPAKSDIRHVGGDYNDGKPLPFSKEGAGGYGVKSDEFKVGTVRKWPALDDAKDVVYTKQYVLRGIGNNVEVWVATGHRVPGRRLPQHGRRRRGHRRHRRAGGVLRPRVRHQHLSGRVEGLLRPADPGRQEHPLSNAYAQVLRAAARRSFQGDGDRIVTLIDNVRDSNYYTPTAADGKTYIAGFHYSLFNEYTNRNVMTLDAWDWTHRTGDGGVGQLRGPGLRGLQQLPRPRRSVTRDRTVRGHVRPRVPAPARVLREPRRGQLHQRGPLGLGADPGRLRGPVARPRRPGG